MGGEGSRAVCVGGGGGATAGPCTGLVLGRRNDINIAGIFC